MLNVAHTLYGLLSFKNMINHFLIATNHEKRTDYAEDDNRLLFLFCLFICFYVLYTLASTEMSIHSKNHSTDKAHLTFMLKGAFKMQYLR